MTEFTTGVEAFEESHEVYWNIRNFALAVKTPEGVSYQKIVFEIGKPSIAWTKWQAFFETSESIGLMLHLALLEKQADCVEISFRGAIKHSKNLNMQPFKDLHTFAHSGSTYYFTGTTHNLDIYLKNRSLTYEKMCDTNGTLHLKILINIEVVKPVLENTSENIQQIFEANSVTGLQNDFDSLCENGMHGDIKIICSDGKEILAHRAIITTRNEVFASMLNTEMTEQATGVVKVDDISGSTMRILMHFLYTGKLSPMWSESEVIHEFIYAVGKYQLTEILNLLDDVLGSEQVATCDVQLLSLVTKLGLKKAETKIVSKLSMRASQIKSGEEFLKTFGNE